MDNRLLNKIAKALSDATRYRILRTIISRGEMNCGEVENHFTLSQPTISHHLKALSDCNLILVRKEGQRSVFSPNHKIIMEYIKLLRKELS